MAKMSYLEKWAMSLVSGRSAPLARAVRVQGVREAHLGPRLEIARIELLVEPAEMFEVILAVPTLDPTSEDEPFIEAAIFGFLDLVMVAEPYPVRSIRITLLGLEVDAVSSSVMAFRHAGRDAGRKFLAARASPDVTPAIES